MTCRRTIPTMHGDPRAGPSARPTCPTLLLRRRRPEGFAQDDRVKSMCRAAGPNIMAATPPGNVCSGSLGTQVGGCMSMLVATDERRKWELATESIVVKIRWFGIVMGYVLVQTRTGLHNPSAVRAFLALGAG